MVNMFAQVWAGLRFPRVGPKRECKMGAGLWHTCLHHQPRKKRLEARRMKRGYNMIAINDL
jgi:hypothetical protein